MSGPFDFYRLGDLLDQLLCDLPPQATSGPPRARDRPLTGDPAKALATVWPEVVGGEVAANARPIQLRKGRLVVSTSSSAWAQTLQLMGDAVAGRLNERLGDEVVNKIVFRHAGWEEPPSPPCPPASQAPSLVASKALSAQQRAVLAEMEALDLSPALREKIRDAVEAVFMRQQQDSVR